MVTDLGLVFPCLYELYGLEMVRIAVLKRGVGSVERAQAREQLQLHFSTQSQGTHRQGNDQNDIMLLDLRSR